MKTMAKFIGPMWFSMTVNSFIPITDLFFLGHISSNYITVVGIGAVPYALISKLLIGMGVESNRTIARGEGFSFTKVATFSVVFAVILMLAADLLSGQILFFAKNNTLYHEIVKYFVVMNFSLLPTSIMYVGTGVLRGNGAPRNAMFFSFLAVVLNGFFDLFLLAINFWKDPIVAVGVASALADTIVIVFYVAYINKLKFIKNEEMNLRKFIKNSINNAIEKVLTASTLEIIISVFIVTLAATYSNAYFGLDRFYQPCLLFSYAFLEWIVYSNSKNIETNKRVYMYYLLALIPFNLLLILYFHLDFVGIIFSFFYLTYAFLFLLERNYVGLLFSIERGDLVNHVVLIKNAAMLLVLFVLTINKSFNLISFGIVNSASILAEVWMLRLLFAQKNAERKTLTLPGIEIE